MSIMGGLVGVALDRWFLREERHRRQGNIFYIHTKMMMIDPFGPNPRVFSGSANFSSASVTDNDENMLLLSGEWAAEVTPVRRIGELEFTPGQITETLMRDYEAATKG